MSSGALRIFLGSAPGVGKTYRMLQEGNRRLERGADVVIGFVDARGRTATQDQIGKLERFAERGAMGREMNVAALLRRCPDVVLVDDLAWRHEVLSHYPSRWDEVRTLLDVGIDVMATLDVAALESLSSAITKITGQAPTVTISDELIRSAEQLELVDVAPEALRRRLAHGNVYPVEMIDASISNYFRASNLAALRHLAMVWMAEYLEVRLRADEDSELPLGEWSARERIVVGVNGSASDDLLLTKSAALASRVRAEVIAVHVTAATKGHAVDLSTTRSLVAAYGATLLEIADDDVATALVAMAQSEHATHLMVGASQRFPDSNYLGLAGQVLRKSRGIDVHVVSVASERPLPLRRRRKTHFTSRRRVSALAAAAVGLPLVTVALSALPSHAALSIVFPVYLAAVVGLTVWGGFVVGALGSLAASFLENFYFIAPRHSFAIARAQDVAVLVAFLAFSLGVSVVVTAFARRSNEAERARAEAEILAKAAATVATSDDDLLPILDSLRVIFDLSRVELLTKVDDRWQSELTSGQVNQEISASIELQIDASHALRVSGDTLDAHDRAMLTAFLGRLSVGLQSQQMQREASSLQALAEADTLRTSLLRAVSHDLRTPLATIEANVSTLLARDVTWSPDEQRSFLSAIEKEVHRLTRLVANLLDAGRLEAGVVHSRLVNVEIDDLVASALETIDTLGRKLTIEIPEDLPSALTDPDLYERVLANIISNACRFSPPEVPVTIRAGADARYLDLLVIDRGPGVDLSMADTMVAPFQRLGDDGSGAGLGLTVATGFITLLGGSLRMENTPGGGLTVVVAIPVVNTT